MLEKYLGVKLIEAEPDFNENNEEGYFVVYSDGYTSWSPKEVFEEAYRRVNNLTFGLAIEAMKKGFRVSRKGWNGKGMWLVLVPLGYFDVGISKVGDNFEGFLPWIGMRTADNKFVPWLASQTDVLAEDWGIVE